MELQTLGHGSAVEVGGLVGAAQHNGKRGRVVGGPDPGNGTPSPSSPPSPPFHAHTLTRTHPD